MNKELTLIYITKQAKEELKKVDTKKFEYDLASELIIKGVSELKKVD